MPILTYHILGGSGSVVETTVTQFLATMRRLLDAGFQCLDLADWIDSGRPVVERGFALTFDDGDRSLLDVVDAFPRLGLKATVFLVTGFVGCSNDWPGQPGWVPRTNLLNWSEIRDLKKQGISFGSHTVSHPDLRRCTSSQLSWELLSSRTAIETEVGSDCRLVSYPYGALSKRVESSARECYQAGVTTTLGLANSHDDLHRLPRIDAYYFRKSPLLDRLIAGRAQGWLSWRRGMRSVRSTLTGGVAAWCG